MSECQLVLHSKLCDELRRIIEQNNNLISTEVLHSFTSYIKLYCHKNSIKLYRYSAPDYFNIRNFETDKIRLSSNGTLNDIFEGLPQGIRDDQIKKLSDIVYMKCFSSVNDSVLMWSHYADSNRGICVEYDISLLKSDNTAFNHLFPILYEKERVFNGDVIGIDEIVDATKYLEFDIKSDGTDSYEELIDLLPLFLFKGNDWKYENEWRVIYTKAEMYLGNFELENPTIDFDCVTGIYLGYRINKEVKDHIIEIVKRKNNKRKEENKSCISVYTTNLSDKMYGLKFKKISLEQEEK